MPRASMHGDAVYYDGALGHAWVSTCTPAWRRVRARLGGVLQRAHTQNADDPDEYVRRQVLRNTAQVRRRDVAIAYVAQLDFMGLGDLATELEARFVLMGTQFVDRWSAPARRGAGASRQGATWVVPISVPGW